MGGQAAEQIIAGVVLSERLAVTMYGAIHRASFNGQRNLRGLVIDSKFLADDQFRQTITDSHVIESVTHLDHANVVPTFTVESNGPDVVVVTRGAGRYVTVQDLIMSAKARKQGKLATPIAGLIGKSVVEALAHAHQRGVVHGAVHPRSVIIDEDGAIRLDNFVTGRALTTAVAAGADSALWRGHAGYIAPELVVGEDPTPGTDVFAVGAMLFTMLTGEAPPGNLRATPAVERLVQRALDTDAKRRYRTATDLLENLIEALEDDRWELADRQELIREAGLLAGETNLDDATEDLLASLGSAAVSVTPTRPSMDMRAAAVAARQKSPGQNTTGARLDDLLADLGDDHTGVTDAPFGRDPVSELISLDPRKREVIVSATRVPSLDDPDDDTPLPPPQAEHDHDVVAPRGRARSNAPTQRAKSNVGSAADEAAALAAIGELDEGARRVSTAAEQATAAVKKLEQAADRAEEASKRVQAPAKKTARPMAPIVTDDLPPPKLKSPLRGVLGAIILLAIVGAAGYGVYTRFQQDDAQAIAAREAKDRAEKAADDKTKQMQDALPDPGALEINAEGAGIWLRLGRTPLDTQVKLPANIQHDLVLIHDGNEPTEAQVNGPLWTGAKDKLKASLAVTLKPGKGTKPAAIPLQPTSQVLGTTGIVGDGYVHIESTPTDAEVWLFIGANHARFDNLVAGRDYEAAVVKPGFKTQFVDVKADDWRDNDPGTPIDSAKKKAVLSRDVELVPDPATKKAR
ncbi:MAG TPA: protein kinase [Kofleriaceae bacterium]|nr:protein kinase [Kofleriaceae bacterium]